MTQAGLFAFPPGTFRIDREGVWRHEGQEVTHPGVLRNLYANLRADAGGHYLQVGPARIAVEVDDVPFVVTRVEPLGERGVTPQALRIYLSDGTDEVLVADSVWLGASGAPYCRVKAGHFTARFALAAWLQLAAFLEEAPDGAATLVVGARRFPLEQRA